MKTLVGVAIIAGAITLSSVLFIAWRNRGSSSLAFSTAALVGAAVLLVLQMLFELQPAVKIDRVVVAIGVDPAHRSIEHPEGITLDSDFELAERAATRWLRESTSIALNNERRVSQDFVIFSLVHFLAYDEIDWQLQRTEYVGPCARRQIETEQISGKRDCTPVGGKDFRKKLTDANNLFSGAQIPVLGDICLPPNTELNITSTGVSIQNPHCEIAWQLDENLPPPFSAGPEPATVRTEFIVTNLKITYFGLRAKSPDAQKYRDWVGRVVSDWHRWFEGKPLRP